MLHTEISNPSEIVRCSEIDNLQKKEKWEEFVKHVSDTNEALLKNIQYFDMVDMLPADGKFLVDADSPLIFALSEERQHGQMLHVIYICERILRVFTRIGGICELIFFQTWENVWADKFVTLARTALMAHFKFNTNYAVHVLPNAWDESFKSVLESSKPNFLLQYLDFSMSNIVPKCNAKLAKIIAQINMNFIVASGVDCVDLIDVKLSSSALEAFVIKIQNIESISTIDSDFLNEVLCKNAANNFDEIVMPMSTEDVRRDAFVSAAAAVLVLKSVSQNMIRAFLLKCAFFEVLPLKLRACPKVEVSSVQVRDFVSLILHYMNVALQKILKCNAETFLESKLCVRVADLWQENLFYKLLTNLSDFVLTGPTDLGNETAAAYLRLVQGVNSLAKGNLNPFPIDVSNLVQQSTTDTGERCETVDKVKKESTNTVIPSTSQLMEEFCRESVLQNCCKSLEFSKVHHLICRNRNFEIVHHWHSKQKLVDKTKRVVDSNLTKYELKKRQKRQAGQAFFMQFYSNNLEGNRIVSETIVRDLRRGQRPQKAHKENKMSQKALTIINEQDQKRKDEIVKQESEKLKVLIALQKGNVNKDVASKIIQVKNFLKKVTCDEVKHEAQMLLANLYYKLLKYIFKVNEQRQFEEVFVDFFLLLMNCYLIARKEFRIMLVKVNQTLIN